MLYQSSLELKNFPEFERGTLVFIRYQVKNLLLYRRLVRDGKLREVSVSFFRAENYAVAKEILVTEYCIKVKLRASIGETQGSHCQRIILLPRRMTQNVSDVTKLQEDFLRKFCNCVCYI